MVAISRDKLDSPLPSPQSHAEEHILFDTRNQSSLNDDGSSNYLALRPTPAIVVDAVGDALGPADTQPKNSRYAVRLDNTQKNCLSQALVRDTITVLPVKPDRISEISSPSIEVSRVEGDDASFDVQVTHHFRAHIDDALPPYQVALAAPPVKADSTSDIEKPTIEEISSFDGDIVLQQNMNIFSNQDSPRITLQEIASPTQDIPTKTDVPALLYTDQKNKYTKETEIDSDNTKSTTTTSTTTTTSPSNLQKNPSITESAKGRIDKNNTTLHSWEIDPTQIQKSKRLAVGGFAEVFLGKYQGTLVAIKCLLDTQDVGIDRFIQEVAVLASLRHPNLILFMGYTTTPCLTIVSEYMQRGSLFKVIESGGRVPLPPVRQRMVAISVARGMSYLHSRSPPLLHLDLKSPNILIDHQWHVKIADFGLSRNRINTFIYISGAGTGTPQWMAPEVLECQHVNEKADVYSYGVVLWECLTGQAPWEGINPMQVVGAVGFRGQTLPDPPSDADPFLSRLSRRCMARKPEDRPSFSEIVVELEGEYAPLLHMSMHSTLSESSSALGTADPGQNENEGEGGAGLPKESVPGVDLGNNMDSLTGVSPFAAAATAFASSSTLYSTHGDITTTGNSDGNDNDGNDNDGNDNDGSNNRNEIEHDGQTSLDSPFARFNPFTRSSPPGTQDNTYDNNNNNNDNNNNNTAVHHGHPLIETVPSFIETPKSGFESYEISSCTSTEDVPRHMSGGDDDVPQNKEELLIAAFDSAQL